MHRHTKEGEVSQATELEIHQRLNLYISKYQKNIFKCSQWEENYFETQATTFDTKLPKNFLRRSCWKLQLVDNCSWNESFRRWLNQGYDNIKHCRLSYRGELCQFMFLFCQTISIYGFALVRWRRDGSRQTIFYNRCFEAIDFFNTDHEFDGTSNHYWSWLM